MYIGIDLGTSNSSIASYKDGQVEVALTPEGEGVLPSVIYVGSGANRLFGQRAYEQMALEPQNVAAGFKRLMGTSTPIQLACGVNMTPEDASSEIIRQLISQLKEPVDSITGCVLTIPAAFNQMQSEATLRAAHAAGLERVALLQEPIAASMAAIARQSASGLFLVYDLGGGTFDVALVQSVGGNLNVLDNLGINMLGGRDFDHSIFANHVVPFLKEQYKLPFDFFQNQTILRVIQMAVEKGKIELSSKDETVITVAAEIIGCKDLNNQEVIVEVPLSRLQLRALIEKDVHETIALCQRILSKNGYTSADISRIVFIGGPSKTPWLQELVAQTLQIEADFSIDPMTAVAQGAAIYAESRNWGDAADTSRKSTRSSITAGSLNLRYDYPTRVTRDNARIKAKVEGELTQGLDIQIDSLLGWTSGKVKLELETELRVPVPEQGENKYRISVFDRTGQLISDALTTLTITRVYASVSGIPATHTIAAKIVSEVAGAMENALDPVIEKGTLLPAKGVKQFRAARAIHAGEDEYIDLELYQQEHPDDKPQDCLAVGAFRIKGGDLLPGMVVRKGDEIICQWSMNDSGILKVAIDVPSVGQTFDTGHMYVDSVGHRNFDEQSGLDLVNASLDQTTEALKEANEVLPDEDKAALAEAGKKLQEQRRALNNSHQPEVMRRITENLRDVRQRISSIVNAPHNKARVEQKRLDDLVARFNFLVQEHSVREDNKQRFDTLVKTARAELDRGDDQSIKEASKLINELFYLYIDEMYAQPSILTNIFRHGAERRGEALDKERHDRLVQDGYTALERRDFQTLKRLVSEMEANFIVQTDVATSVTELAGLMRG